MILPFGFWFVSSFILDQVDCRYEHSYTVMWTFAMVPLKPRDSMAGWEHACILTFWGNAGFFSRVAILIVTPRSFTGSCPLLYFLGSIWFLSDFLTSANLVGAKQWFQIPRSDLFRPEVVNQLCMARGDLLSGCQTQMCIVWSEGWLCFLSWEIELVANT